MNNRHDNYNMKKIRLFGLGNPEYARKIAYYLDMPLSKHVENLFPDGDPYIRSDVNVRGCDVYVVQSLYRDEKESASEKFTKLLFFINSLKDASAKRISLIMPYIFCSRMDRKTESRAPITTKYIAKLLEAAGADRVLTIDIHNLSALQNSFRIPVDNLEAKNLIIDYILGYDKNFNSVDHYMPNKTPENLVLMSPDSGGMSRTRFFRKGLEDRLKQQIDIVYYDKERINGSMVKGDKIVGDVKDKNIIIVDDVISSGGTVRSAAEAVEKHGGKLYCVCATHGVFTENSENNLKDIDNVIITDTVKNKNKFKNLHIVSTAKLFASAILRTHRGGSISELLE